MPKDVLKRKAEEFVGKPTGFTAIATPGNIANFVFIKFDSPENMQTFIGENKARAEDSSLRKEPNLPQGTPEVKARRSTIWQGKQVICQELGLAEKSERVIFSRGRFWCAATDGLSVTMMGSLASNTKVHWNVDAPAKIKGSTSTFS